jgi:hypothetical protein
MNKVQFFALPLLAAALLSACGTGTGSQRFSFDAEIGGSEDASGAPLHFRNEVGWEISLSEARVTLGPIYLNSITPLQQASARFSDWFVKPAWAAGESHLDAGRVVGEVLGQVTFDALTSELVPFPVPGTIVQEQVRTAEIWFYPEYGASGVPLALSVRGSASKAGQTVAFRGELTLDDDWVPNQQVGARGVISLAELRKVRGIPASFMPFEGGRLELRCDVRQLFRGADFASLRNNPSDPDGTKVLVQSNSGANARDQVMTNLYQGLREATGVYSLRFLAQ